MKFATLNSARICFDGNSITVGNNYGDPNDSIPKQVEYQLKQEKILGITVLNYAIGGQTCDQMIADGSQTLGAQFDKNRNNFLIVNEGGNDITFGATPQQAFENLKNYCLLRKAEGYYVLVWDCLFRNNSASGFYTAAAYKQALIDFNFLVRSNWKSFAHGYMDSRKEFPHVPLNDYTGALNGGFWFPDCIHPSPTANGIIASKLIQYLKTIPDKNIKANTMVITQRFTTAGAFSGTVPSNCSRVKIKCKGGDGGGGSGRKGAPGTARLGGGGGSAGAVNEIDLPLSALNWVTGSSFSGTVGTPGIGGASQTTNSTNGITGGNGGASRVVKGASGTTYIIYSNGGFGGAGGTGSNGNGGSISTGMFPSVVGSNSSATANAGNVTGVNKNNGSGAAGGGISTGNVAFAGGNGGRGNNEIDSQTALTGTGGLNTGGIGGNGRNNTLIDPLLFDGGGGGGASLAGNGGNGGFPCGGGGAAVDGIGNSGKGADGKPGYVEFIFY